MTDFSDFRNCTGVVRKISTYWLTYTCFLASSSAVAEYDIEPKSTGSYGRNDLCDMASRLWDKLTGTSSEAVVAVAAAKPASVDEWSPCERKKIIEGIERALGQCNEVDKIGDFLDRVGTMVRKALTCHAITTTTAATTTPVSCSSTAVVEWSPAELKVVLDAIERLLCKCNDVNDVNGFLENVGALVRRALLYRSAAVTDCTTECTAATTPKRCGRRPRPAKRAILGQSTSVWRYLTNRRVVFSICSTLK